LIKKHQPRGNSIGKDDKSYNFVVFTKEDFPALKLVRGHDLSQMDSVQFKYVYGPFPHGLQLKKALKIIRKIFPYRDEKCKAGSGKPCFNRQIGLCPGVCDGSIGKREYAKIIRNLKLFFEGKKGQLLKTLNSEMQSLAKEEKFEEAQEIKRQLFALNHIQDVALIKSHTDNLSGDTTRIEGYDVAHMSGQNRVGVMVVVENAEAMKSEYRKFNIKTDKQGDTDALREILERRFTHSEWPLPKLIVVDGGVTQENIAKKVLEEFGYKISIVAVTKNASHKPINLRGEKRIIKKYEMDILLANSEAHRFSLAFHKKKRSRLV
jgi:excinuclease ABC subunit C